MRVVVCGAGVIGAAVAYYLSLRGVAATVVERAGVACAASGKSGGFPARDWCDGSPLGPASLTGPGRARSRPCIARPTAPRRPG